MEEGGTSCLGRGTPCLGSEASWRREGPLALGKELKNSKMGRDGNLHVGNAS